MLNFTKHSSEYISVGKNGVKIGSIWINTCGMWVLDLLDNRSFQITGDDFHQIGDKLNELNEEE